MKIGFVSRKARTDRHNHVILATQFYKPVELATNITMSVTNMWGIIKMLSDKFLAMEDGKVRNCYWWLLVCVVPVLLGGGAGIVSTSGVSSPPVAAADVSLPPFFPYCVHRRCCQHLSYSTC
jgi:hypothetical protein